MSEEIISEIPISMIEMKQEIKAIKKRDETLGFRANKVEEYLDSFGEIKMKEYEELVKALEKLDIPRLKDIHIIKIADLLPKNVEELKVILQGYTITVNKENMEKIIGVTKKFLVNKK